MALPRTKMVEMGDRKGSGPGLRASTGTTTMPTTTKKETIKSIRGATLETRNEKEIVLGTANSTEAAIPATGPGMQTGRTNATVTKKARAIQRHMIAIATPATGKGWRTIGPGAIYRAKITNKSGTRNNMTEANIRKTTIPGTHETPVRVARI